MEAHDNPFNRFMLFPKDHAFADPSASEAMGLDRHEHGMLLCEDQNGNRWTLVGDAEYLRTLIVAPHGVRRNLSIPPQKFPTRREGWPDDWADQSVDSATG
jgi:hypothetical protein